MPIGSGSIKRAAKAAAPANTEVKTAEQSAEEKKETAAAAKKTAAPKTPKKPATKKTTAKKPVVTVGEAEAAIEQTAAQSENIQKIYALNDELPMYLM